MCAADRILTSNQYGSMASTLDGLRSRIPQVHEQKTYICDTCGIALASRAQLWLHRRKAHDSAQMQYLCVPCQLTYAT